MSNNPLETTLRTYGYKECEFDPQEDGDTCDHCGVIPMTLYVNADYFGEINDYSCANCVLKRAAAEREWDKKWPQGRRNGGER